MMLKDIKPELISDEDIESMSRIDLTRLYAHYMALYNSQRMLIHLEFAELMEKELLRHGYEIKREKAP